MKKTRVIKIRVSDEDLESWRQAAELDRRTLADWIRARCFGAAKPAV